MKSIHKIIYYDIHKRIWRYTYSQMSPSLYGNMFDQVYMYTVTKIPRDDISILDEIRRKANEIIKR